MTGRSVERAGVVTQLTIDGAICDMLTEDIDDERHWTPSQIIARYCTDVAPDSATPRAAGPDLPPEPVVVLVAMPADIEPA